MGAERAFITGAVIRWARERARVKQDQVARRLHAPLKSVVSWELEKSAPTLHQAERLAEVLHVPLGYLFLPSPPDEKIPLPDFRTVRNIETNRPSAELIDLLNDILVKQQWYREFLLEQGTQPLAFVASSSMGDGSERVAESIREVLHIDNDLRQRSATWNEFLRSIVRNAEVAGILVMRSGIAAGNTRRPLSVQEFRGFAISDPIAPLVFVNGRDWPTAQIFTLAHELVHIWIGKSGISNENLKEPLIAVGHVERFCNETAAEILLPKSEFLQAWQHSRSLDDNVEIIAQGFRVSTLVALRRAFDLERINWKQYRDCYEREEQAFRSREKKKTKGGHAVRNVLARNSVTLAEAVVRGALEGQVLYRDAARLLNVSVPLIQKIARYLAKQKEAK